MIRTVLFASAAVWLLAPAFASAEPIVRYTFDEASGDALDTGDAPANNGEFSGGATRSSNTPGGTGFSLDLRNDATNAQLIDNDPAPELDGLTQLTLTTWLNVSDYPSGNKRLVSKQAASGAGFTWNMNATPNDGTVGADNFKTGLFVAGSGAAGFTFDYSSQDVDANSISAQDHWVFLAVTYDGTLASDNTKFYIGDATTGVSQLGLSRTLGQVTINSDGSRFGVGFTDAAASADTSVNGLQDDVRVYGSVLSPADLDLVRAAGAIPEPCSMVLLAMAVAALGLRVRV